MICQNKDTPGNLSGAHGINISSEKTASNSLAEAPSIPKSKSIVAFGTKSILDVKPFAVRSIALTDEVIVKVVLFRVVTFYTHIVIPQHLTLGVLSCWYTVSIDQIIKIPASKTGSILILTTTIQVGALL